jgi:hypothetical protein
LALAGCGNAGSAPFVRHADGAAASSSPAPATGSTSTPASIASGSAKPVPALPSGEAVPMPHLRKIGPDDQSREVVIRFGDRLDVVPASRAGGWVVTDYPTGVLRLQGSPGAASSHTFLAISLGEGQLTLAPAGPEARSTGIFMVRIRVLRDTVQPPQS